jgi:hypothetical protein
MARSPFTWAPPRPMPISRSRASRGSKSLAAGEGRERFCGRKQGPQEREQDQTTPTLSRRRTTRHGDRTTLLPGGLLLGTCVRSSTVRRTPLDSRFLGSCRRAGHVAVPSLPCHSPARPNDDRVPQEEPPAGRQGLSVTRRDEAEGRSRKTDRVEGPGDGGPSGPGPASRAGRLSVRSGSAPCTSGDPDRSCVGRA